MTSKNLLWNRCTENIKRNSWLWVVNFFILIFYRICKGVFFIAEDGYSDMTYDGPVIGDSILPTEIMFLIIVLAIAAGVQGFSYLHSRIKVDMYHSQPVSERSRFLRIYINGILCFGIPRIIGWLLEVLVIFCCVDRSASEVDFFGIALKEACFGMVLELFLYFAIYQIAVLMTILTSNVVFSVACTVAGLFYEAIIRKIVEGFSENFFHTYYIKSGEEIKRCRFSVLHLFEEMRQKICYGMSGKEMLRQLIYKGWWIVILAVITAVLAYTAYKRRSLENVKMPFAFLWMRTVFKGALMIPGILLTVYLAEFEIDMDRGTVLLRIFFLLLAAFVSHCVLEIIFEKDLKAVWKHKTSAAVFLGIAAVILVIFQFDLFGYNSYIPKEEQIESIALVPYEEEGNADGTEDAKLYEISGGIWDAQREDYILEHMKLSSIEELCGLAKDNYKYTWEQAAEQMEKNEYITVQQTIFAFHMKNGKTIYRNYYIVSRKGDRRLRSIQQSMEYIQGSSIWLYNEENTDNVRDGMSKNSYSIVWIDPKEKEKTLSKMDSGIAKKIGEILKKDIEQHGRQVRTVEKLIGRIAIWNKENEEYEEEYMIYPQYHDTILYLEELRVKVE